MPVRPSTRREPAASHHRDSPAAAAGRRAGAAERPVPPSPGPEPAEVLACHPPDGAEGDFHRTLAHVSLAPGSLSGGPRVALLVFAEGELPEDPGATGRTAERIVRELLRPAEKGVAGPVPEAPGAPGSPCRTLDVPAALFAAVAPKSGEAPYLTHTRPAAEAPGAPGEGRTVVTANRFPSAPGRYAAHLVSLDGHPLPPEGPGAARAVRLHSLASWSFRHGEQAGGARAPRPGRAAGNGSPLQGAALRLPRPGEAPPATAERLRLGYVPVPHRLPSGERAHAWYRGPAVPVEAALPGPEEASAPRTAESALLRDGDGAFDVSLAAAWRLGNGAARADSDRAEALARARRELAARAAGIVDGEPRAGAALPAGLAAEEFGRILAEGPPAPAEPFDRMLARAEAAAALDGPEGRAALAGAAERAAAALAPHLERLALLDGVPLRHLVPHPEMLPPESLCPFRTDPAWIDALLAGAASSGGTCPGPEARIDDALRTAAVRAARPHRPEAGLLIRSRLVEAGPELPVAASTGEDRAPVRELRRDRLALDVLLVLFDALPEAVEVGGTGRGSWFGLGRGDAFSLRVLAPGPRFGHPRPDGAAFPDRDDPAAGTVLTRFMREDAPERRVLRLSGAGGLVRALADALGRDDLTPDEFALHLVDTGHQRTLRPRTAP